DGAWSAQRCLPWTELSGDPPRPESSSGKAIKAGACHIAPGRDTAAREWGAGAAGDAGGIGGDAGDQPGKRQQVAGILRATGSTALPARRDNPVAARCPATADGGDGRRGSRASTGTTRMRTPTRSGALVRVAQCGGS